MRKLQVVACGFRLWRDFNFQETVGTGVRIVKSLDDAV